MAMAAARQRVARLAARRGRRFPDPKVGQAAYDMMLGDCLWQAYGMIGGLDRGAYVPSRPG
jgi:hypothetical protein